MRSRGWWSLPSWSLEAGGRGLWTHSALFVGSWGGGVVDPPPPCLSAAEGGGWWTHPPLVCRQLRGGWWTHPPLSEWLQWLWMAIVTKLGGGGAPPPPQVEEEHKWANYQRYRSRLQARCRTRQHDSHTKLHKAIHSLQANLTQGSQQDLYVRLSDWAAAEPAEDETSWCCKMHWCRMATGVQQGFNGRWMQIGAQDFVYWWIQ